MQPRKFRILSAVTAGSLALAVVAITASAGTTPTTRHAAFAQTESFPPVNLDACPVLHAGYPTGGCVAQLQTDLNATQGDHLVVDGTFGSQGSQTYAAVIAFQQAHGLAQDGMVGPATKQALDTALPVHTPTVPPATTPAPTTSQAPSTPSQAPSTGAPVSSPISGASDGSGASGTSGAGLGLGPVTINCGYVTCSAYLSRSVTRAAYQKSTVGAGGYAAAAAVICAPLAVPPLTPVGIACGAAAALQGPWIAQELSDAATQHGATGACLKVTYTKPVAAPAVGAIPPSITWWSTNNGQYCKD